MNALTRLAWGIWNGLAPAQSPKALPYLFDFSTNEIIKDDFLTLNVLGVMQFVQSVYIDNSRNSNPFELYFPITQQRLVVPAGAQGVWPVFAPDQTQFVASTTPAANLIVTAIFLNVPMPLTQWGPIDVTINNPTFAPITRGNWTDRSGTIAVAGTSQQLAAANANRTQLLVQNPTSQLGSLFVNYGAAAAPDSDSIEIAPGQTYLTNIAVDTRAVNIVAADQGHVFIAKEM